MKTANLSNFALFCLILIICALIVAFLVWSDAGTAHASPDQGPYICSITGWVVTVCIPNDTGYNSGYPVVRNIDTGEQGAVYLDWQPDHPEEVGLFIANQRQFLLMGEGTYIIEEGWLGIQKIRIDWWWQVFDFEVTRLHLPAVAWERWR